MKKILLLLFLCTGMVKAQNVDIPDANFKAALLASDVTNAIATDNFDIGIKIDANNDGEIQESEAQLVSRLNVGNNGPVLSEFSISDLTGIGSFINLTQLNCSGNQLTTLDVSALTLLLKLDASQNQITTVNVAGLPELKFLDMQDNQLQTIDLTGLPRVFDLNLSQNLLSSINLAGLTDLGLLNLSYNQLTTIDFSNATNMEQIYVSGNQLTAINLTGFPNLIALDCSQNAIPSINFSDVTDTLAYLYYGGNGLNSLDVSTLVNLISLFCDNNNLSALDISALPNLTVLNCSFNNLTSLNLSATSVLNSLDCSHNQIANLDLSAQSGLYTLYIGNNLFSTIDVSNNTAIAELHCESNLFTSLDFSNNLSLFMLIIADNLNLETVFINNEVFGQIIIPPFLEVTNCPNLRYMCVNEAAILQVQNQVNAFSGATNVVVNSYCTFSPSGDYDTISGNIKFDSDNNGCDANDEVFPYLKVNITEGTNQGAAFLDSNGNYQFFTQAGNYTVTPAIENPTWFNFTPPSAEINFSDNNNNTTVQDFCLSANGIRPDVSVVVGPIIYARPGFEATYQLVFTNNGNQTLSGLVSLNFNDNLMNFTLATVVPDSNEVGVLGWNYVNLQPFQSRSIEINFAINSATDVPPANIGDQLAFSATILPIAADETPADNEFQFTQTVVDSEILNDIYCLEGDVVDPSYIGEYLHYMINFENVGNIPAQNVVIRFDVDPANFDINSLQLLNASNVVYSRIVGNTIEFIFQNINLEIGGHGSILLKLRTVDTLVPSDVVENRANIFFDYNSPVSTGLANTTFQTLANVAFINDEIVSVFPNPTSSIINVKSDAEVQSIALLDMQGRVITTQKVGGKQIATDLAEKAKGIYFLKIVTSKGSSIKKVIKE